MTPLGHPAIDDVAAIIFAELADAAPMVEIHLAACGSGELIANGQEVFEPPVEVEDAQPRRLVAEPLPVYCGPFEAH